MATSSSVQTSSYDGRYLKLTVAETSTSIDSNTSTITWTLESIGGSVNNYNIYDCKVTINGSVVYGPVSPTWDSYSFPAVKGSKSGTITIQHNADGSASDVSFTLRGSVRNNNPQNYDGSINLTNIPRASTITSISGGTIGSTISISISRMSSNFTHDVYCTCGSEAQMVEWSAGTSASTTLKMDFCNQITNSTTASATMYVETWNNGVYIGTTSMQFTMSVPSNVVPTISSATKTDTSNLLATYGAYVQGKSSLKVDTTASGSYSSTISNIAVNIKDSNANVLRTLTGSSVTLPNISYTGTLTIEVIATDTRGRTATNTSTIVVAEYSNPLITSFTAERLTNDSTITLTWDASITNINNNNTNTKSFKIYAREKGTSSWGSAIVDYSSAYTYTSSGYTITKDANKTWEIKFDVKDAFSTTTQMLEVGTAFELINWGSDGNSMAIGKVAEYSNTFEVGLATKLLDDTTIIGDTSITGDVSITGDLSVSGLTTGLKIPYATYYSKNTTITISNTSAYSVVQIPLNNNALFETSSDGSFEKNGNYIKCNFTGVVLVMREYHSNMPSDYIINDHDGCILNNHLISIYNVSTNDNIDFRISGGGSYSSISLNNVELNVIRLS